MPIRERNRLFQPAFAFPMISVGVLAVAFLVYYFPVTAQQEASLNRRAFRSLAAASDSVQIRVGALTRAFGQAVKPIEGRTRESVETYLKAQTPDLELTPSIGTEACVPEEVTFGPRLQDARHFLEFRCGGWRARVALEGIVGAYLRGTPEQIFDDVVLLDGQGSVLYQSIRTGSRITRLPQLRPAAGTVGVLDGGNPPSGTAAKPPAFAESSQSSSLVSVDIAGEPFNLYLVPIALELTAGDATEGASGKNLILGGLMRVSRFRADSMAVPGTALVSVILLVLIVIAATWPLLKFTSMRATERIPRRSGLYFFASTLATIILVCVLAIHLQYIFDLGTTDEKLKKLGGAIEQHFDTEVRQALAVMDSARNSGKFARTLGTHDGQRPCNGVMLSTRSSTAFSESSLLTQPNLRLMEYPYFDRVFWSDNLGHQHIKWDASALPTPPTFVGARPYFVETVGGNLWQFAGRPAGTRFRVDSLFSQNTGEYTAVISQRVSDIRLCKDRALSVLSLVTPLLSLIDPVMPPDYGFAVVDDRGAVLFHSTASKNGRENFLDEVEDAGELRAALFAGQGRVLTARYLGFSHRLSVTRLLRIQPSPWSLVVFHNLFEGAAEGVVRSVLFSVLALLYFAGIVLVLVVMSVPFRGRPPTWIWPRSESRGDYLQLTLTITGFAVFSYLLVFETTSLTTTLATAFTVPVFAMAISALKLRPKGRTVRVGWVVMDRALMIAAVAPAVAGLLMFFGPRTGSPLQQLLICEAFAALALFLALPSELVSTYFARVYVPSLASSVAVSWASMLILAGMLPCVAFFKVAYHYHNNLSVKRQQLQTVSALAEREARVRAHYARIGLTRSPNDAQADVMKWLFLRRRLDSSLDRYDEVFLGRSGQVYSPDTNRVTPRGGTSASESVCDDGLPDTLAWLSSHVPFWKGTIARTLDEPPAETPMWRWCLEGSNRIRLEPAQDPLRTESSARNLSPGRALFKAATGDPLLLHPEIVSELALLEGLGWWPLFILAGGVITFCWIRPTLQEMFLLNVPRVEPLPVLVIDEQTPIPNNLVLLGADTTNTLETLRRRPDVALLDCRDMLRGTAIDCSRISQPVIAILHLDYDLDSANGNRQKLELLEGLLAQRPSKRMVVVAESDPVFHFGAASVLGSRSLPESVTPGQEADRWARVFLSFTRMRLPAGSAMTPEQCRVVWSTCTAPERVALHQLARDQWANPKNEAALQQLQLRGLITGVPFRCTDESLQSFVHHAVGAKDRKTWALQDDVSLWDGIRLMFLVLGLGAGGAVLFFNQQSVLGLVLTGISVMTPVTKLLSEAQSFRSLLGLSREAK